MNHMKSPKFTDAKGRPTAYAFACGAIEKTTTAHLVREGSTYMIYGWNAKGERIVEGSRTLSVARRILRTTN